MAWETRQSTIYGGDTDRYEYDLDEIREDWVSMSHGNNISLTHDAQDWTVINGHPLIAIMRIVVWNAKTTCTPLQQMSDWEEFFTIYDERVSKINLFLHF